MGRFRLPEAIPDLESQRKNEEKKRVPAMILKSSTSHISGCSGYCARCGRDHSLPMEPALEAAHELMRTLEREDRIDLHVPRSEADPAFSLDYLRGEARGQMFGVLVYEDASGRRGAFRAFSCQYNGVWEVPEWVPPVFDVTAFHALVDPVEREIKGLGRKIEEPGHEETRRALVRRRREMSRELMREIHGLYRLHNFRGELQPMAEVFQGAGNMPTGTGDCCAPKLLQHAAVRGVRPLGLAEFYLGRENRSGTRRHGVVYPACEEKCRPILGFQLCGIDKLLLQDNQ
jgi:hypothetical protein